MSLIKLTVTTEVAEGAILRASPIACATADAWLAIKNDYSTFRRIDDKTVDALDAIELVTRESSLRKALP